MVFLSIVLSVDSTGFIMCVPWISTRAFFWCIFVQCGNILGPLCPSRGHMRVPAALSGRHVTSHACVCCVGHLLASVRVSLVADVV
jgi:hypothetical protein